MKRAKKRNWLVTTLCVLLACAVIGTILSAILFNAEKGKATASASIQFSFDGAAEGVAPNGYTFSLSDMTSDTVLEKALADAGMADRYTADEIRPQLEITGVYPKDIVEQMTSYESLLDFSANREVMAKMYHPTLYSVVLYNGFDRSIVKSDMEKLLTSILAAYKETFREKYALGTQTGSLLDSMDSFDYPQRLTLLERTLQESADYAAELYEKEPALRKDGIGFNDIAVMLNNLITTNLEKLKADVTINALTWNKDRLITQYTYYKESLQNELIKRNTEKDSLTALIKSYEQDQEIYMSTANGATQIESNTKGTYEELQKALEKVNDRIIEIKSSISSYEKRLNDLGVETDTENTADTSAIPSEPDTQTTQSEQTVNAPETTEPANETAATEEATETVIVSDEDYDKNVRDLKVAINALALRREEVMASFNELIDLYNKQEINDLTVTVSDVKFKAPSLLSGAFIVRTLKVAGPICAVGFMVCLVLLIISRRKEEKLVEAK